MSVLEDRYRFVLRALPAAYRDVWEEEMVATFLDSVTTDDLDEAEYQADFGRPGVSEVASVAALAVRLRLGGVDAPARSFAWGEAARRVALVGLLINAVASTMGILTKFWFGNRLRFGSGAGVVQTVAGVPPPNGFWSSMADLSTLVWLAAFFALVFGYRRSALVLAGLGLVPAFGAVFLPPMGLARGGAPILSYVSAPALALNVLVVLAVVAFHRDAPPVRPRPWLVAFGAGLILSTVITSAVSWWVPPQELTDKWFVDWPGVCCLAVVAAVVVQLAGRGTPRVQPTPAWSLALAVFALAALGQRVASLMDYARFGPPGSNPAQLSLPTVEAAVDLAAVATLVVLASRGLRRLPPVGADTSSVSASSGTPISGSTSRGSFLESE